MAAEPTQATARPLFENRTYLFILVGNIISIFGDTFHSLALAFWVLQTTHSGTAMAIVTAAKITTGVLAGPFAGAVADRVDRRRLMITMDLARVVLVGLMVLMVRLPHVPLLVVVLTACGIALCNAFMRPAFSASMINIVGREQVGQAQATLQTGTTLASIVGPSIGGAVFGAWGASVAFGADAASYLLSALCILAGGYFASPRSSGKGPRTSFWADMREGLGALRSQPLIKALMVAAPMLNFMGNAMSTVVGILVIKEWMIEPKMVGVMEGSIPVGLLVGGLLLMATASKMRRRGLIMGGAILLSGLVMAPIPLFGYWPMLGLNVVDGLCMAVANGLVAIILQRETPPQMQGRVFGLLGSVAQAVAPVGTLMAGSLSDLTGAGPIVIASGVGIVVLTALCWTIFPALRNYD